MLRIVPYPGHPDYERHIRIIEPIPVNPNIGFDPDTIKQLGVIGNVVVDVETGEEIEPEKEPEESDV